MTMSQLIVVYRLICRLNHCKKIIMPFFFISLMINQQQIKIKCKKNVQDLLLCSSANFETNFKIPIYKEQKTYYFSSQTNSLLISMYYAKIICKY